MRLATFRHDAWQLGLARAVIDNADELRARRLNTRAARRTGPGAAAGQPSRAVNVPNRNAHSAPVSAGVRIRTLGLDRGFDLRLWRGGGGGPGGDPRPPRRRA